MNHLSSKHKPISHFLISLSHPSRTHLLSLFSTSSSSPSSSSYSSSRRRDEEESRNVRVSVWWDIENCGVPSGSNVFKIAQHVTSAVRMNGIKGPVQISAFGDVLCISRPNQEALTCTGINLIHVPNGRRNSADRSLLVDLMYWVSQNPPPAHVFLISSDRDFAGILHRLRMNNYNILLAGKDGNHTPGVLCGAASIMWHWNELARGENLSGRHFNQPPDGPFNSWYGHYRGPLEDPFGFEQQSSSIKADDSSDSHAVPKAVLKQIRQIVNSYPNGLSITELRSQLAKNKVTIDKNFYGHNKFSQLLLSMPHILKVVNAGDGQFYLRPVSRKVLEAADSDGVSDGSMAEHETHHVPVIRKANRETQPISKMVDVEPRLPISAYDDVKEETVEEKVEETSQKKLGTPSKEESSITEKGTLDARLAMKERSSKTEKETLDARVVKIPVATAEDQSSTTDTGFLKRCWKKWIGGSPEKRVSEKRDEFHRVSGNPEKSICGGGDILHTSSGNLEKENSKGGPVESANRQEIIGSLHSYASDLTDKSKVSQGLVAKVLNWFKSSKNRSPVNVLTEQSSEEPSLIEEDLKKHEDASQLSILGDASPDSRKHHLFSKETFWSAFELFLRTNKGSDIALNSASREQFAKALQSDGPLVLRSLQESNLLQLVDLLVSEKKWVKEFPARSPRFTINLPPVKTPTSAQAQNANGLSSMFSSSSRDTPRSSSNRLSGKSRSEILADCQKVLDELLQQNPEGFNMGLFKIHFHDKYGYALDYQKLGYPKLVSLLQIMPGVKIESCQVLPDSVVYAPGIASLGSKEKPSGSDSEVSDSPLTVDDVESQWEELGPVATSNLRRQSCTYEQSMSEDDEFSDSEDDEHSTTTRIEKQSRLRMNEDDSSLLQILNSWYSTSKKTNHKENNNDDDMNIEGLVDCSKEETEPSGSHPIGDKGEASSSSADGRAKKPRAQKSYTFVADSIENNKEKLIDGILGSIRKPHEPRMQG